MLIQPTVWCDLTAELKGWQVAGFSSGPDQRVYLLAGLDRDSPRDWRVLTAGVDEYLEYLIPNQPLNFHFVQPMPDGLLLGNARRQYSEPNGHIFGLDGVKRSSILLGDGIQDLATTQSGEIWASYFDEGVFGDEQSPSTSGLAQFHPSGTCIFEFQPISGLEPIDDCYALNVSSSSETWCYYYTQFPLVRIRNGQIDQYWECPIRGANAFAVWRNSVLMRGSYECREEWTLMTLLDNEKVQIEGTGRLENALAVTTRGRHIWYLRDGIIFHIDLKDLVP